MPHGLPAGGDAPRWLAAYVDGLWRMRYAVAVVLVLLSGLAVAGAARLMLASNYEIYFDRANPRLEALNALHRTFSRNDNVLFALAPDDRQVFTPRTLAAVGALTRAAWRMPYAVRVDSVVNFQNVSSDEEGVTIRDLVPDSDTVDGDTAAHARGLALAEPALLGRLITPAADVTGVNVRLELTGDTRAAILEVAQAARALGARIESEYPHVRVHITGNAMLNAAFPEASVHDLTHLVPFMYLVIALALWALLRSLAAALAAMLVVAVASLLAMGTAGWLGIAVSSASVTAPTIIATVAIADSVHLLASFLFARAAGATPRAAVTATLAINLQPVAVTSLTTAVGFLSLNFSEAPPFRDLGNITTLGVAAAFVLSVVVLPLLLLAAPPRQGPAPVVRLDALSRILVARQRGTLAVVLVATAAAAAVLPRLELNDAFVEYFDERVRFRRDTDFVMRHLTGIYQVEYAIGAGGPFGVHDPDYLATLDAFASWLEAQPEVVHVAAITEVLKRLNRHLGDGGEALPPSDELAAQYLLIYGMSVPFGLDLNDRVDVSRSASRVTVTLRNVDNETLRAFEASAARWLEANAPAHMHAPPVGAAVMFAYIAERNIRAMLQGIALAIGLISVVLIVVFRNVAVGLLSLLPNLVPAVIAFGIWTLLVGRMGVALAIVSAMSLGVVVDDTVHFTSRFLHARRRLGLGADDAVRHAFATTGTALASTSLVLVLGFAVLSLSAFEVNHGMGQLTALVIVCALAADFMMLPGLLAWAARRGWA